MDKLLAKGYLPSGGPIEIFRAAVRTKIYNITLSNNGTTTRTFSLQFRFGGFVVPLVSDRFLEAKHVAIDDESRVMEINDTIETVCDAATQVSFMINGETL